MAAFTLVYVSEELETSVFFYASLKDTGCTLTHQLIVDNCVCSGSPTDLPCFSAVFWKDSIHQEIPNRLTTTIIIACWGASSSCISASGAMPISASTVELPIAVSDAHSAAPGDL